MTEEEKNLLELMRKMDFDIEIRFLRIQRLKRQMAEELDPFGEEFDRAAEQLKQLLDEQDARSLEILKIRRKIAEFNWNSEKK